MCNLLDKIINYLSSDRELFEEIQLELEYCLKKDNTLSNEDRYKLMTIIHNGAYLALHSSEYYKSYVKEARIYNDVIRKNKHLYNNIDLLYNEFKKLLN